MLVKVNPSERRKNERTKEKVSERVQEIRGMKERKTQRATKPHTYTRGIINKAHSEGRAAKSLCACACHIFIYICAAAVSFFISSKFCCCFLLICFYVHQVYYFSFTVFYDHIIQIHQRSFLLRTHKDDNSILNDNYGLLLLLVFFSLLLLPLGFCVSN